MSNSQYDNPAKFNPDYLSYTPYPTDFLSGVGQTLEKRHDAVDDEEFKLRSLMANTPAIREHQGFKKELDKQVYDQLTNVSSKVAKGDLLGAKKDLREVYYNFLSNPIRQELERSYNNYGQYQKKRIDMGDKYAPWEDPTNNFKGVNPDKSIEPFQFTGMGEVQDHQKRAEEMMKIPHGSGYENAGIHLDNNGNIWKVDKGYEGIAQDFIKQLAKSKAESFGTTKEGQGFLRQAAYQGVPQDQLQNFTTDYLTNAGLGQMYSKTTNKTDFHYAPKDVRKKKDDSSLADVTTSNTNIVQGNASTKFEKNILDESDRYFEKDGTLKDDPSPRAPDVKITLSDGTKVNPQYPADKQKLKNVTSLINNIQKEQPDITILYDKDGKQLRSLSHKEILDTWVKAKENFNEHALKQINPSELIVSDLTKKLFGTDGGYGDLSTRVLHVEGTNTAGDLQSAAKALGYKDDIPSEVRKAAKVTGIVPIGNDAGDLVVSIPDSDGKERKLLVENDNEIKRFFRSSQEVYKLLSTFSKGDVKDPITGVTIHVKPYINPHTHQLDPEIHLTDSEGNEDPNTYTLEDIIESEKQSLMKSNYLNTKLAKEKR